MLSYNQAKNTRYKTRVCLPHAGTYNRKARQIRIASNKRLFFTGDTQMVNHGAQQSVKQDDRPAKGEQKTFTFLELPHKRTGRDSRNFKLLKEDRP
jgi:hypothetical protein